MKKKISALTIFVLLVISTNCVYAENYGIGECHTYGFIFTVTICPKVGCYLDDSQVEHCPSSPTKCNFVGTKCTSLTCFFNGTYGWTYKEECPIDDAANIFCLGFGILGFFFLIRKNNHSHRLLQTEH